MRRQKASFTVKLKMGGTEELFENVNLGKKGKGVVETINQTSKLVMVAEAQSTGSIADRAPELGNYILKAAAAGRAAQASVDPLRRQRHRAIRHGRAGDRRRRDHGLLPRPDVRPTWPARSTAMASRPCSWR